MEINVKKYFYSDNLEILVKSENTTIKEEYKISDFQDFVVDLLKESIYYL